MLHVKFSFIRKQETLRQNKIIDDEPRATS